MYRTIIRIVVRGLIAMGWTLAAVPPLALAGTNNLGTIDVTAERQPSPIAASAVPVTVIDRKTIEASHARNVAELLQGQADIIVRDTSGIGVKPMVDLGGFGETGAYNSVVLIDGRRVNSPDLSGVDWNQIPLDQIERIEILHGGGASLYGSGAVGGVINIITRIPESGGHVSVQGGSFDSNGLKASLGAATGQTRIDANMSSFNTKGYRVNGEYNRFDGGIRVESDLPAGVSLRLSSNYHHDRMGLPGPLTEAQTAVDRRQSTTPNDFSRTVDSFVDAGLGWDIGSGLSLDLDGGYRHIRVHAVYSGFPVDTAINTQSLRPKFSYRTGWASVRIHLLAGADIQDSRGTLSSFTFRQERQGIYGHFDVGNESGRWNLSGGLRSAQLQTKFTYGTTISTNYQKPAWDVGISYALTDHLRARLNMEQSVRFPLLDERYNYFTNTVNVSMKPQTGRQMGASLRYTQGVAWIEASFRRADLTNEIYLNPLTYNNENYLSGTRHDVWMVVGHWHASDLMQLSASYTYTSAKFRSGTYAGRWIPAVPQQRADVGWTADWTGKLGTTLNLRYIGKSYLISDQANVHAQLPGYAIVNAVVRYHWRRMHMFARVDNLTNRKYSSYGAAYGPGVSGQYYYPAAGIMVSAGAGYRF